MPLRLANQSKDYVMSTYGNEYKKCGGNGYIAGGKAIITTGLVVTSDSLSWLADYLNQKKEQGKAAAEQAKDVAKEKKDQGQQVAKEKKDQGQQVAKEKKDQGQQAAKEKKDQGQQAAKEKTGN